MGRAKDVKIAGTTYSTNDYLLTDTTTVTTSYATGEKMKVETDRFNQPIKTTYIDADEISEVLLETQYDSLGRETKSIDNTTETEYNYKYDGLGNVIEYEDNNNSIINTIDSNNRLTEKQMFFGGEYFTITPTYEKDLDGKVYPDNVITELAYDNGITSKNKRDAYGRISEKQVDFGENSNVIIESYRYLKAPNDTSYLLTNLVRSITYNHGENEETIKYTYDNNGNITCVTKGFDVLVRYEYDEMNQLIREDNKQLNRSYLYRYDNAVNIILKDEHEYIYGEETATLSRKEYTYSDTGWKDKLTSFDGQSITYDALGNPLNYLGHSLTWDRVRQLKTFDNNTFAYDGFGKRSRKNSVYYLYDSDKLIKERRNGTSLVYFYDTNGICGFRYNVFTGGVNSTDYYFYLKNLQGDVTDILNQNGNIVAEYLYDAWGKCYITYDPTGIGAVNPIRYRSYYYDTETGLYYLNSRYYDPNTGRFINADSQFDDGAGLLGYNLYSYCSNNPMAYSDPSGESADSAIEILGKFLQQLINKIRDFLCVKDNTYLNETQMQLNATLIYLYLKRQEWSDNAIFAVLGNMQSESTISPGRYQVNGGAFGLVQWDPATKYTDWAVDNGYANDSVTGQLLYLINSMQPGQGEWFRNKNYPAYYLPANEFMCSNASVDYLTLVFLYSYERPRNPNVNLRKNNALYWSNYFN